MSEKKDKARKRLLVQAINTGQIPNSRRVCRRLLREMRRRPVPRVGERVFSDRPGRVWIHHYAAKR